MTFLLGNYFVKNNLDIIWLDGLVAVGIEIARLSRKNCLASLQESNSIFHLGGQGVRAVRSTIINKILSFQYRLGKLIGRKKAGTICVFVERSFTTVFGREVYWDGK